MKLDVFELEGLPPLYFRDSTSDSQIISKNLGDKNEYNFPLQAKPKVIFDIGANIGVISVVLTNLYPDAMVYAFEPEPGNFEILEKNIQEYPNIKSYKCALAGEDGSGYLSASDDPINFGGFSLYREGCDRSKDPIKVPCIGVSKFIDRVSGPVDLIKIDAEGSEYDILTRLTEIQLANVKWIVGELHGQKDFELLAYLHKTFALGVIKPLQSRVFSFYAENRTESR